MASGLVWCNSRRATPGPQGEPAEETATKRHAGPRPMSARRLTSVACAATGLPIPRSATSAVSVAPAPWHRRRQARVYRACTDRRSARRACVLSTSWERFC